jgi:hypothetical protein
MVNHIKVPIYSYKLRFGSYQSQMGGGLLRGRNDPSQSVPTQATVCAPSKEFSNGSCFTLDQLLSIANAFNAYIHKKPNDIQPIQLKQDKKYLLDEITSRFDTVCAGDQLCITKQQFMSLLDEQMREDIDVNTFRPQGPKKPTEWLSSEHIDKLMKQYESAHPGFKFMGAVPVDCGELEYCSTYEIDFNDHLKQNHQIIGIVYNLDDHTQGGSHWVALYIDISNGEAYFFDSMGGAPPKRVENMLKKFKAYNSNATIKINTIRHQQDKSECGVYSCNFIIRLLRGESFDHIVNNITDFEAINSCRNKYFYNKTSQFGVSDRC